MPKYANEWSTCGAADGLLHTILRPRKALKGHWREPATTVWARERLAVDARVDAARSFHPNRIAEVVNQHTRNPRLQSRSNAVARKMECPPTPRTVVATHRTVGGAADGRGQVCIRGAALPDWIRIISTDLHDNGMVRHWAAGHSGEWELTMGTIDRARRPKVGSCRVRYDYEVHWSRPLGPRTVTDRCEKEINNTEGAHRIALDSAESGKWGGRSTEGGRSVVSETDSMSQRVSSGNSDSASASTHAQDRDSSVKTSGGVRRRQRWSQKVLPDEQSDVHLAPEVGVGPHRLLVQ